jgi:hypothetical protein
VEDMDHTKSAWNALPRALSNAIASTKTITCVKAEVDDNDPSHQQLQAIPRCCSS